MLEKLDMRGDVQEIFKSTPHEKQVMMFSATLSTDIWGRGIDIERVNIVINYDMPEVSDTYLHRVGRAGRFGTKGLAITFVSNDEDAKTLEDVQSRFEVSITQLPEAIDVSSYMTA